jgi:transcriptional regulator with XRE-family HTH domain
MSRKMLTSNETFPGLPNRIKLLRGAHSQQEYGKLLGVSKATVSKYESGINIPSSGILKKIASVGNKSIEWLLRGDQPSAMQIVGHTLEICGARPGPPLDVALLVEILSEIKKFILDERLELSSKREARWVALVYDHCQVDKVKPDRMLVERFLWITKVD